jgi:tRNA threonylcarbamoyl adenosine modification protein YeaZ
MSGIVLAWDTSTNTGTAAVGKDGDVISRRTFATEKGHTGKLMMVVDVMLDDVGAGPADVEAIAVGTGPGNFTGVKVGVATAKGMALGLEIPLLGVSTLDLLTPSDTGGLPVVTVMDARRGTLYAGLYDDTPGREYVCASPQVIADAACGLPGEEVLLAGTETAELASAIRGMGKRVSEVRSTPHAAKLIEIYFAGERATGDAVSVMPLYLKPPV